MNNNQKAIFIIMVISDIGMGVFPPWRKYVRVNSNVTVDAGYSFLFDPPTQTAIINISTLFVQISIITVLFLSIIYLLKSPTKKDGNP